MYAIRSYYDQLALRKAIDRRLEARRAPLVVARAKVARRDPVRRVVAVVAVVGRHLRVLVPRLVEIAGVQPDASAASCASAAS